MFYNDLAALDFVSFCPLLLFLFLPSYCLLLTLTFSFCLFCCMYLSLCHHIKLYCCFYFFSGRERSNIKSIFCCSAKSKPASVNVFHSSPQFYSQMQYMGPFSVLHLETWAAENQESVSASVRQHSLESDWFWIQILAPHFI